MIFNVDNSYKYIVSQSDNFIIFSDVPSVSASWQNPKNVNLLVQYISPSTLSYKEVRIYTTSATFTPVNVSSSFWDRGDSVSCALLIISLCFSLIFIFNVFSKFLRKGGVFFG